MNKCPKCESPVLDGSKFCGNCGASLAVSEHAEDVMTPSIPGGDPVAGSVSSSTQDSRPTPTFGKKGRCKYCGHQVLIGSNPCPNCGHELRWGQKMVQIRVTSGQSQQSTKPQSTKPRNEHPGVFSFWGRARRSTYWGTIVLLVLTAGILGGIYAAVAGMSVSYAIEDGLQVLGGMIVPVLVSYIVLVICGWAVQVRRCHDLGWSGWLVFMMLAVSFIPVIGWIVSLIFNICLGVMDGQPFANQYGPDPKGRNTRAPYER